MSTAAPSLRGIDNIERTGRSWHVATFVAVVAAVASLAVAIIALNRSSSTPTSSTVQLAALKAELATARSEATAALSKDGAAISKITTCLPELSGEINGLTVETGTQGGFVTSAYIQTHSQVSSYCKSTLETGH